MLGGSECGNILSFDILTIKPNSAGTAQPSSPTTYNLGIWALHSSMPSITTHCHPEPLCLKEVTCVHLLPLTPWEIATKSTTLASRSCYVNGLCWGKKQTVIYKPPSESSLSSQIGNTCSGRITLVPQLKFRDLSSSPQWGGTQDHETGLYSQPVPSLVPWEMQI